MSNKEKHLGSRFTKQQEKAVKLFCKKNKIRPSELIRTLVLKEVGYEG